RLGDLQGEDFEAKGWGFTVKAITRQMQIDATLPDTLGVIVVGVKRTGPAGEGGLRAGDVIQKVNDAAVGSLEEFAARYRELSALDTERILLTVSRTGSTRFVLLKADKNQEVTPHE
ncbi:MAG TPA: PDZ domain-containing protein, partial [candidate division Zixibacteria bacterium]|nr:PDZ domain-containing protein [candidate division Zixibacteria bacterium]